MRMIQMAFIVVMQMMKEIFPTFKNTYCCALSSPLRFSSKNFM